MSMQAKTDLYLFPVTASDPILELLLVLRENGNIPRRELYPALVEFACQTAFTPHTVREYVVRSMLRNPPPCRREGIIEHYLLQDVRTVFELFFQTDWDALCARQGLLPLPSGSSSEAPGETTYREMVKKMTLAPDARALYDLFVKFFTHYTGEEEAIFRAFAWDGSLVGVPRPDAISFDGLHGLEHQKDIVKRNTAAFAAGLPANDILLIGSGGTGKSSCVKAALNEYARLGVRLVEIRNDGLEGLPRLMEHLSRQSQRYLVFIDDLSFETADKSYLALKVALDGQTAGRPDNVLIYATSNRRHLVRESWRDRSENEDIHENDTVSEKLSLSERFGVRLYFPSLTQKEYLAIVRALLDRAGIVYTEQTETDAAAWAGLNNGWSGRSAKQFVRHAESMKR